MHATHHAARRPVAFYVLSAEYGKVRGRALLKALRKTLQEEAP